MKRCPVSGKSIVLPAAKRLSADTETPRAFSNPKRDAERPSEAMDGSRRRRGADSLQTGFGKRYILRSVLGQGGMGVVYEATDENLARHVAVKILTHENATRGVAVQRFQQEAKAAGRIVHPNICRVFDCGTLDDGRPYLVMERLQGRTFHDYLARERVLDAHFVVTTMIGVLNGLAAAHERGVLHRDIKPDNIFLAKHGTEVVPKILDFGVSKFMQAATTVADDDEYSLTRTGMVMGTPEYLSPEQASGDRKMDGRVDTYACGVVMYQALVGERPFKGKDSRSLLLSIVKGEHRKLGDVRPDLPYQLIRIVQKAMARQKADRFPTAEAFSQALTAILPLVPAARREPRRPEERSRSKMPAAADSRVKTGASDSVRKKKTGATAATSAESAAGPGRSGSAAENRETAQDEPPTRVRR